MDHFLASGGRMFCENVAMQDIADAQGTPAYVYSRATLSRHCEKLKQAFAAYPTLACFAVKANSNLHYLREVFSHGLGADLVSLGELERARIAGVDPGKVVFSGVGKREDEIVAALDMDILSFNVESEFELANIARLAAERGVVANISLRINPNIDAKTNPKITTGLYNTKFGLPEALARRLIGEIGEMSQLRLVGLACHIGSQITDLAPLGQAALRMAAFCAEVRSDAPDLKLINMGGGLGIRYRDENPPGLDDYAQTLISAIRPTGLKLVIEPGRVLAGNTGVLLTRVIGVKTTPDKTFVVVDGAMNDLLRPSMYDSFHDIVAVDEAGPGAEVIADFVGPVCETGDTLGKDRAVALPSPGDLFVVRGCGAYAASMSFQYNSRPRAPELLVDGSEVRVIRRRETLQDLWSLEQEAEARPLRSACNSL